MIDEDTIAARLIEEASNEIQPPPVRSLTIEATRRASRRQLQMRLAAVLVLALIGAGAVYTQKQSSTTVRTAQETDVPAVETSTPEPNIEQPPATPASPLTVLEEHVDLFGGDSRTVRYLLIELNGTEITPAQALKMRLAAWGPAGSQELTFEYLDPLGCDPEIGLLRQIDETTIEFLLDTYPPSGEVVRGSCGVDLPVPNEVAMIFSEALTITIDEDLFHIESASGASGTFVREVRTEDTETTPTVPVPTTTIPTE